MSILEPSPDSMATAAAAILSGDLVVIPTETVYGIAANALDANAVAKIFLAKGRPSWNPLIVHVSERRDISTIADDRNPAISILADAFWPGPLTIVLPTTGALCDAVTAGLDTVAVRIPNHPVTLDLLRLSGVPLAAPSANLFTELSPTRAEDVAEAIEKSVSLILDGGPCSVGIESTVLDLSKGEPSILRPGMISKDQIEEVLLCRLVDIATGGIKSPGQHPRHYAPRVPVRLVKHIGEAAGLCFGPPVNESQVRLPLDPAAYAQMLYSSLATLDQLDIREICVEEVPDEPRWGAIRDRLERASYSGGK